MAQYETYIKIMSDFGEAIFWDQKGVAMGCYKEDCDFPISQSLLNEFYNWHSSFEGFLFEKPSFNWNEYHKKGISLAKKLKKEVGENVKVVYQKPFEDPNHYIDETTTIN